MTIDVTKARVVADVLVGKEVVSGKVVVGSVVVSMEE